MTNGASKGRSAEEIKALLHKISANTIILEKFNNSLDTGKIQKNSRKESQDVMMSTVNLLKRAQELLGQYDGPDAPIYRRKMVSCSEKVEELIHEIRDKEQKDLGDVRRSMAKMSIHEGSVDEQKQGKSSYGYFNLYGFL